MSKSIKKQIKLSGDEKQAIQVVHIIPNFTNEECTISKKRIGNDIYEIFSRMRETIKIDKELQSLDKDYLYECDICKTISR